MENKSWAWFAVVGALVVSCSGNVSAPTSNGQAGGPNGDGGKSSSAGGFNEEVGGAILEPCAGTLTEVSDAWGFSCPEDLGSGTTTAAACDSLPSAVVKTSVSNDRFNPALVIELSEHRTKVCLYRRLASCPETLVGASITAPNAFTCEGNSRPRDEKRAGTTFKPPLDGPQVFTLCDLDHPENNHPDAVPPRRCQNQFSSTCEVCCPETPPNCSDQADTPSADWCTPNTREGSYCSCGCRRGEWQCPC